MADRSAIEWTDASWNPIRARHRDERAPGWYCEKVSLACAHCYAEAMNMRLGTRLPYGGPGFRDKAEIYVDDNTLLQPLRWKRPRKIFVCSMTDLFGEWVTDEMLDRIFAVMALCPQHTFQLLTKRPERMRAYIEDKSQTRADGRGASVLAIDPSQPLELLRWPLPNVWLGVTAEDQPNADKRIPFLLTTAAALHWVSHEPALGPIDYRHLSLGRGGIAYMDALAGESWHPLDGTKKHARLRWIVTGGESGPHARPMHPNWARSDCEQCAAADVAFHFKQWGEWAPPASHDCRILESGGGEAHIAWPDGQIAHGKSDEHGGPGLSMVRIGKKRAGRLLDGFEHSEFPENAQRTAA